MTRRIIAVVLVCCFIALTSINALAYRGGKVYSYDDLQDVMRSIVVDLQKLNRQAGHTGDNIVCALAVKNDGGYAFYYSIVYEEYAPAVLGKMSFKLDPINGHSVNHLILYEDGSTREIR